jgi:vacuolar-type H+-ATPase subunit E/Vma4
MNIEKMIEQAREEGRKEANKDVEKMIEQAREEGRKEANKDVEKMIEQAREEGRKDVEQEKSRSVCLRRVYQGLVLLRERDAYAKSALTRCSQFCAPTQARRFCE